MIVATVANLEIPAASKQYVRVQITSDIDPTHDVVTLAFPNPGQAPSVFYAGSWLTFGGVYYAQCLIGPGGTVQLPAAFYDVYVKIGDNPEIPVIYSGLLAITSSAPTMNVAGTWTYIPGDLSSNEKDQVRLEIGDTDPSNWLLSDEEITYALSQERNFWAAAARCAEMCARVILRKADLKLGRSMQILYAKSAQQYYDMARCLRAKSLGTIAPYVGGMTIADKQTIMSDSSLVAPKFTKTMMENPWAGGYTTDSTEPVSEADNSNPEVGWI